MGPKSSPGPIRAFPSQFGLMGDHEALREAREALPMYKHRADFVRLFRRHRTLIVVGETGSGKTTRASPPWRGPRC